MIDHLGSVYKGVSEIQVEGKYIITITCIVIIYIDVVTKESKNISVYIMNQNSQFIVLEFLKCFCSHLNSMER